MRHFRPRDPRAAARQCLGFTGTAAIVQLIYFLATKRSGGLVGQGLSLGIPASLGMIALLLARYASRAPDLVWVAIPLLGVLAIVVLDVTSHDASVQAQVFLIFPVLFAASQLPPGAAVGVTVLSVIGELIVTFSSNEHARDAAFDSLYVTTAIVAAAVLLTHSTRARDELIEHLGRQVGVDALTSLMTRRALGDVARQTLDVNARRRTGSDIGIALILIDLDRFKTVNDTYGHPVGDDFLVHVATFLTERLRIGDLVARLGGDEFAVLMTDCSPQAAQHRGQSLLDKAMEHPFPLPAGGSIPIRFTMGVGHVPAGTPSTLRDLYAQADRDLYAAKSSSRTRTA
jgi:diguanylate cyclase (GGDEF)-like protein